MTTQAVRSTFYLEPGLHRALRRKAATAHRSMSEIVSDAVRALLREDGEDLAVISDRAKEKSVSYEQFLAKVKADGALGTEVEDLCGQRPAVPSGHRIAAADFCTSGA